jgi:hypothetical protein
MSSTNSCAYKPKKILTQLKAEKCKVGTYYHPTEFTFRSGACPKGSSLKKGYYRNEYIKKDGTLVAKTYVDPTCIKNKGLPGKTIEGHKPIIIKNKNMLHRHGYSTKNNSKKRFDALINSAKNETYKSTVLQLSALKTLTKRTDPEHSHIYDEDMKKLKEWRKLNPDLYKKSNNNSGKINNSKNIKNK